MSFRLGILAFGSAVLMAAFGTAWANDDPPERKPGQRFQRGPFSFRTGPLMSRELLDKLELSSEQKDELAKIQKEFEKKSKDAQAKLRESMKRSREDGGREGFQKIREQMEAMRKLRTEYRDKAMGVLNDDQKKKYEAALRDRFRGFPGRRPPQPPTQPQPRPRPPEATRGLSPILPPDVQRRLKLTDEQKDELTRIQKEFEKKIMEVLTGEQKKELERLNRSTRPRTPEQPPDKPRKPRRPPEV